jgi:hypothetical protein
MKNADRITSIIMIGICGYFFIEGRTFTQFGKLFPHTIIAILGLLSLLLLILSFTRTERNVILGKLSRKHIIIVISVLLIAAWGFFINILGFVVSSILFFSLINIMLDKRQRGFRPIFKKVGIIAVVVGAFYFFFAKLLLVPFPRGYLF